MYKYYLFIINNNSYKIYKNNSEYLYNILNVLYHMKKTDLEYGINLYKNLCNIFSVKLLDNYLIDRFNVIKENDYIKLKSNKEETSVKIKPSRIIIKSNKKFPEIFRIFNIYNKRIFVIDFKNKKYFWLNDYLNKVN